MKDGVAGEHALGASPSGLSSIHSPLIFPRVPLAVPYWSGATYREIIRAIVTGGIIDGAASKKLCSLICDTLEVKNVLLSGSGTLALELALRVCGVEPGDEVILPAFCCSAIVPPILAVDGVPVLADVGAELNLTAATMRAAITRKTKAVVVPHLFGNPADIEAIAELARSRNIRVIDDAAQALGATIDGRPVGGFGDAGVLSFGREKVCFGLGGGALLCRSEDEWSRIAGIGMTPPRFGATLENFLSTLVWRRWRRWTAALSRNRSRRADPDAPPGAYQRELMANLNAAVAANLLHTLDENIASRRARVRVYQNLLGDEERLALIPHRPGSACLTQLARVSSKNHNGDPAAELVEALAAEGYEIQGSYVPIHLLGVFPECVWDHLSYSERVWADLIELPCDPGVTIEDVARIADIVRIVVAAS
ncbi:MAG: DegT/DnrJ/EryC1/StrS family aminotransferase [Chloroflexota bacterium]